MRFDACCAVHDAKRGSYDPTGLTVPRRRFERDMIRRFTELKRAIRAAVVTLDVLGLKNPGNAQSLSFVKTFAPAPLVGDAIPMPAPSAFSYGRASEKVSSFMEWLYQAEQEGILEIMTGTPLEMAASSAWQNVYIDTAYQKGMRDAYSKATKKSGAQYVQSAFNQPVHADAAGLIYTRSYTGLVGITDAMDTAISRTLAQAILEGRGAMDAARMLEDRVDAIGITRARTLARSEMTAAYAEAQLNTYEEIGIEGVEVEAEFATAGDDSVCPECEELEGKVYSIEESRGVIPVHPNCRCAWIPVVPESSGATAVPASAEEFE